MIDQQPENIPNPAMAEALRSEHYVGVTVLGSGSRGNATVIHCGNEAILIDAGFSARELQARLNNAGLDGLRFHAILVTHEHDDHVRGLRVCAKKLDTPVFATTKCANILRSRDSQLRQFVTFVAGGSFDIGCFGICPFSIPHDAEDPVAFAVYCQGVKVALATDVGFVSSTVEYELQDCGTLVVESNHDLNMLAASSRPWSVKQRIMGRHGHLSNESSAQLLEHTVTANTQHVILAHMSSECNTPEIAVRSGQEALAHLSRTDIHLALASQNAPLATAWLKAR